MWKDFFYFSKREKQGILLLIVLLGGIFIGRLLFAPSQTQTNEPLIEAEILNVQEKVQAATLIPISSESVSQPDVSNHTPDTEKAEKRTYYQQNNNDEQSKYTKTEKYPPGTVIDLNMADSLSLKKVPGIGPVFAKRIVKYRNLLGGYYKVEQLQEVYGMYVEMYEKITPYLKVNSDSLRYIPVNTISLNKLKSHPYIGYDQAKAIINLRKKNGKIENISELQLLEDISETDLQKIEPYLKF